MILIAIVDDNYGMMFNHRRQSKDRILRSRILDLISDGCLWMNSYSKNQFEETIDASQIRIDDNFLEKVPLGEYCFVENESISSYENKIEKIFLFKWNKQYPSDFYFDIFTKDNSWKLVSSEEFTGYSHDKITLEVYEK